MIRTRRPRRRYAYLPDGGELFRMYYQEMGQARSYIKLSRLLATKGYTNPKTGNACIPYALWYKVWRWALMKEHQQEAYQIYNDALRDEGRFMTFDEFKAYLDEQSLTVFNQSPRSLKEYRNGVY